MGETNNSVHYQFVCQLFTLKISTNSEQWLSHLPRNKGDNFKHVLSDQSKDI